MQAIIAVGLGSFMLGIPVRWEYFLFVLVGVGVGTAGWFFFLATFALRIRRNDMFNTLMNVAYFILMFVSTMFYPVDPMPVWFQRVAYLNPITWHTDALRYFTIGVGDGPTIAVEAMAFVVFLIVSFAVAVRTLQRVS